MASHKDVDSGSFLRLPYSDRQLIIVIPDEAARATREAERQAVGDKQSTNYWLRIGEMALITVPIGFLIAEVTKEAIKAWQRARASGIQVLPVGKSEAATISFPPGHPREGVLYIGHPAVPCVYYTTAEFHRVTFEHKLAEAINLLMSLGATKIHVEHVAGWSKAFSSRLSIPLGTPSQQLSAKAGINGASRSQLLYEATLDGASKPCIPEGMVWYPHESTWQSIAKGRIQFGLRNFSLTVSYEDDFGVHAGLKAQALKAGLELGGKFEDHVSTIWRIEGEFGPAV